MKIQNRVLQALSISLDNMKIITITIQKSDVGKIFFMLSKAVFTFNSYLYKRFLF